VCHRWWLKGERAPGRAQQGYQWAYIFAAIRPTTGEDCTLVPPVVSAAVMALFLAQFAATLPADAPAGLVLDGAGWHDRGLLPSLERPRRRNRPPSIALPLSLDHKARFINSLVLGTVLEST
jgi:hypothetical protein